MDSPALLIWGTLFGAIGLGFFIYGKKQKAIVPLATGIALFMVPYFVSSLNTLIMIGCALIVLPFLVRT